MQQNRTTLLATKTIAFSVMGYGLIIIADTLLRQARLHSGHDIDTVVISLPLLIALSYVYLGSLLLRRKYNAWITAVVLSGITLALNAIQLLHLLQADIDFHAARPWLHVLLPFVILILLLTSRGTFQVKSDIRSFRQAVQVSVILLLAAFLYGVGGFMLMDTHDFHQRISVGTAVHQTIDQFGLTDDLVVAHSKRARLFLDSLPVISIGAAAYVAISFFQPLRVRFTHQLSDRNHAERLLHEFPGDIDDFFKLWPHDKSYYFDNTGQAGLAYHVTHGVALVVGDPFGDSKRFGRLTDSFLELCFVNDWLPGFIHTGANHRRLYSKRNLQIQKIGEEAILHIDEFQSAHTAQSSKYFRQITNRFTKLGYTVKLIEPPHAKATLSRLQAISHEWLQRPGRQERRLLLGYHSDVYVQQCRVALLLDDKKQIRGYLNIVPTFTAETANFDLLRCSKNAPGNANDFLLLNVIEQLSAEGKTMLNLGLCPLAGLDDEGDEASLTNNALRFVYANGDRFYSFAGLQRFKAKYNPAWEPRYVAYPAGIRNFTRIVRALNQAMKVK